MNAYRFYYTLNGLNRRTTKEGNDQPEAEKQLPAGAEVLRVEQVDRNTKHIDEELYSIGNKINNY